jgi:hypothetical protein
MGLLLWRQRLFRISSFRFRLPGCCPCQCEDLRSTVARLESLAPLLSRGPVPGWRAARTGGSRSGPEITPCPVILQTPPNKNVSPTLQHLLPPFSLRMPRGSWSFNLRPPMRLILACRVTQRLPPRIPVTTLLRTPASPSSFRTGQRRRRSRPGFVSSRQLATSDSNRPCRGTTE